MTYEVVVRLGEEQRLDLAGAVEDYREAPRITLDLFSEVLDLDYLLGLSAA